MTLPLFPPPGVRPPPMRVANANYIYDLVDPFCALLCHGILSHAVIGGDTQSICLKHLERQGYRPSAPVNAAVPSERHLASPPEHRFITKAPH